VNTESPHIPTSLGGENTGEVNEALIMWGFQVLSGKALLFVDSMGHADACDFYGVRHRWGMSRRL
jgi:hypothetical protein